MINDSLLNRIFLNIKNETKTTTEFYLNEIISDLLNITRT